MSPDYEQYQILECLLADEYISFNISRSADHLSQFPRKVTLLNSSPGTKTVIPGIKKSKEQKLINELKQIQNWKTNLKFAFEIYPNTFSFLWRFNPARGIGLDMVTGVTPLKPDVAKKIRRKYAKYRAWLKSYLKSGAIFRMPDATMNFRDPNRRWHPYARRVLILDVRPDQIVVIPFSTQIHRIRNKFDILFDPQGREDLTADARPAVDSFHYRIFDRKVVLCVWHTQSMTERQFLDEALTRVGSVRKELLDTIRDRVKKMSPITFKHE